LKILVLFLDMVRANRLNLVNNSLSVTPLDEFLKELGGTLYNNAFSSYPDTGRAIGNFLSGKKSFENGCDNRVKYPRIFLKGKTIFDFYLEKEYKINLFLHQKNILPQYLLDNGNIVKFINKPLKEFLNKITLEDSSVTFIDIPTFHSVLDNCGYTEKCEKKAFDKLVWHLREIFNKFKPDEFEHIFIFSDHGFKFTKELIYQKLFKKKYLLINEDRTQILFFHRQKGESKLEINNNLTSLNDMFYLLKSVLLNENYKINNEYVVVEDHFSFIQSFLPIEIWGVVTNKELYIRLKNEAILINRITKEEKKGIIEEFDNILYENSLSFKELQKMNELSKISNSDNLSLDDAKKCKSRSNFLKKIDIFFDLCKGIK